MDRLWWASPLKKSAWGYHRLPPSDYDGDSIVGALLALKAGFLIRLMSCVLITAVLLTVAIANALNG
ncbi:MAG: hypothetical protein ACFCA4_10930 [Cyanophyceae cyanobacterium]